MRVPRRLTALLLAAAAGCGPVTYINQVTRKAATDVEAARAAQADQYAPYHYTLAIEYLRKAREEAAHADFEAANRFGSQASAAARKAVELSIIEVRNRGRAP